MADINLTELQKTLDAQGLEIIDNQKENMLGRKKLAEQTRGEANVNRFRFHVVLFQRGGTPDETAEVKSASTEFKKVSDEEKLGMFRTLLKGTRKDFGLPCLRRTRRGPQSSD